MAPRKKETEEEPESISRRFKQRAFLKTMGLDPDAVLMMGDDHKPKEFISTGVMEIDELLGGGAARGSVIEFCGESQAGKTHVALMHAASMQKRGLRTAFLNAENAFYEPRAVALGVDVRNEDSFEVYGCIDTAETYGKVALGLIDTGEYGLIIIDSISAMVPEVDFEKDLDDNPRIGAHAQFVNRFLKKLMPKCAKTNTTVILVNQFRYGSGAMPNSMVQKATGGAGMDYFTHTRLWFKRLMGADGKVIGNDNEPIGGKSRATAMKNRFAEPWRETIFPIYFQKQEVNYLGEFLYRAAARGKEYIAVKRKEYQYEYINTEHGTVDMVKSKDPVEFLQKLLEAPAPPPEKLTRGDNSKTAFEYITNRLRMNDAEKEAIITAMDSKLEIAAPTDSVELPLGEEVDYEE